MKKFIALGILLSALTSFAAGSPISTSIEPIVGYERVQKFVPTAHTSDRLVYGARLLVGVLMLQAEGEYTHSSDTETFPASSFSTIDTDEKAKVGLRSTLHLLGILSFYLRAGGQAKLTKHQITLAGVTSNTVDPISYNPYAGAGLRFSLGRNVALSADIVAVFLAFPNMNNNEYMTTAGLNISFP